MKYDAGVWVQPYAGNEWEGFGTGAGQVTGDRLRGSMRWANQPRRREDGVWCPDLRGYLTSPDGAQILVEVRGLSIREKTEKVRRAIVAAVWFHAQDPKYRWLNYRMGIGEGEIDEETEEWWIRVYECRNEVAAGPPAIGE